VKHVDMRKLPAASQEERRQVIGLRQAGMTYDAIAAQVGLSPTGVFDRPVDSAEWPRPPSLTTGPPTVSSRSFRSMLHVTMPVSGRTSRCPGKPDAAHGEEVRSGLCPFAAALSAAAHPRDAKP
jgi:hypothetical protein